MLHEAHLLRNAEHLETDVLAGHHRADLDGRAVRLEFRRPCRPKGSAGSPSRGQV